MKGTTGDREGKFPVHKFSGRMGNVRTFLVSRCGRFSLFVPSDERRANAATSCAPPQAALAPRCPCGRGRGCAVRSRLREPCAGCRGCARHAGKNSLQAPPRRRGCAACASPGRAYAPCSVARAAAARGDSPRAEPSDSAAVRTCSCAGPRCRSGSLRPARQAQGPHLFASARYPGRASRRRPCGHPPRAATGDSARAAGSARAAASCAHARGGSSRSRGERAGQVQAQAQRRPCPCHDRWHPHCRAPACRVRRGR